MRDKVTKGSSPKEETTIYDIGKISVKAGNTIIVLSVIKITAIYSQDQYRVICYDKERIFIRESLNSLAQKLPNYFIKIQRSTLINLTFLKIVHQINSGYEVILEDYFESSFQISRSRVGPFFKTLGK